MKAQPWLAHKEAGTPLAIRTIVLITRVCGHWTGYMLLYPICLYFMLFRSSSVRASRRFLERVLGRRPGFHEVFRHHLTFASCILDRVRLATRPGAVKVRAHGRGVLTPHLEAGRGCLLFSAHLGSFEALRAMATRHRVNLKMLMYRHNAGMISDMAYRLDPALEEMLIEIGRPDTLLEVQRALDAGGLVGILADRAVDADKTVQVQLLGEPIRLPKGPFLLAILLNAPVVLSFGIRRGPSDYDIYFETLASPCDADGDQQARISRLAQRYADRLSHYVRHAPYNWFNFYDYWSGERRASSAE